MEEVALVALVVVVVALVAGGIWFYQRRRSEALQTKFGSEYDRAVDEGDSRHRAEAELRNREKRVERLDIHPLDAGARRSYQERWQEMQRRFVDDPAETVGEADRLVIEVMRDRGYPVDDFEQRAADLSVDHPDVVDNYRIAHGIAIQHERGEADTEDLRRAVVAYRALVDDLLEDDEHASPPDRSEHGTP